MPFLPFPEYRPDVNDFRGQHTQVLSGVLPRGDGYGPMKALQAYVSALGAGNDTYTKVLLHFEGTDGGTTITDSNLGGSSHTWTAAGNANTDNAQVKFGTTSLALDGTGDYVTTPDHADFTLGSGDFTVDLWFRCTAAGGTAKRVAGQCDGSATDASTSFRISRSAANVITFTAVVGSTAFAVTGTTQFTDALNTGWHHLACVRTSNTIRMFIDGVQEGGDVSISGTVNDSSDVLGVGAIGAVTTNPWIGWLDEFRLSVGIARWTTTFTPPTFAYGGDLNTACRGFCYARATDGTIAVFAASATRIYRLNNTSLLWEDVSKSGAAYSSVASSDQWQFAQFGSVVVAVQVNVAAQAFTIGSSTAFADLAGSPPQARYIAVVGRFLVLSGLSASPLKVQWSDLDGITTWTDGTGFANSVTLPDGGVVRGVAGGEFGLIIQESTTRRMTFVPGQKPAFQLERISEELGLLGPYSIARAGGAVLFYSQQGFQKYQPGAGLVPIGKERIDRTFGVDLDANNLQLFIGAADPAGTRVFWAYKSTAGGSSAAFDKVVAYDVALERWSPPISISGEYLAALVKPGLTLEGLDTISTSIDALGFTLDSVAAALSSRLAAFDTSHQLGFFDGANLEAILETPEQGLDLQRMIVNGFEVRTDAATVYGRLRYRDNANATLLQTSEVTMNGNGFCPARRDVRLARGRIRIPASTLWTYAMGLTPEVGEAGLQ